MVDRIESTPESDDLSNSAITGLKMNNVEVRRIKHIERANDLVFIHLPPL